MKILEDIQPTPEQLRIISETGSGTAVIRGAAGSGKTHTAILRLQTLTTAFLSRRQREENTDPVRVLVLTYNRTLATYVSKYIATKPGWQKDASIEVLTFAKWAMNQIGKNINLNVNLLNSWARQAATELGLPQKFVHQEIEYVCGRFAFENIENYLDIERRGRGPLPRMERAARTRLISAIKGYNQEKQRCGIIDWNDLALMASRLDSARYDVVIVDEAQDFSANQLRAIVHHLADPHSLTLIIDTVQRLYPHGYTWREVGIDTNQSRFYRLRQNHRNTIEIANFASGLVQNLGIDDDGTLPDFSAATKNGFIPAVVVGRYSDQVNYALDYIYNSIDSLTESVAFLKPRGGDWFSYLEKALQSRKIAYEVITRNERWPGEGVSVALSTMHSAKGLEFDHVFILGFSANVMPHGEEIDDNDFLLMRRLVAMAIARARKTVHIGYKSGEESDLIGFFGEESYQKMEV